MSFLLCLLKPGPSSRETLNASQVETINNLTKTKGELCKLIIKNKLYNGIELLRMNLNYEKIRERERIFALALPKTNEQAN